MSLGLDAKQAARMALDHLSGQAKDPGAVKVTEDRANLENLLMQKYGASPDLASRWAAGILGHPDSPDRQLIEESKSMGFQRPAQSGKAVDPYDAMKIHDAARPAQPAGDYTQGPAMLESGASSFATAPPASGVPGRTDAVSGADRSNVMTPDMKKRWLDMKQREAHSRLRALESGDTGDIEPDAGDIKTYDSGVRNATPGKLESLAGPGSNIRIPYSRPISTY